MSTQKDELKKIVDAVDRMPPLSPTVAKVIEIANNPASSPAELNRVISMDPVLTARVLKLINSAYFSLSQSVTNLTRAIVMLGINTIKNLALSTALVDTMKKRKSESGFNLDAFWEHSLSCAATSKVIGRACGVEQNQLEEYFIAGLIHDMGKLVFDAHLPELFKKVLDDARESGISILFSEQDIIGASHDEVGKWLALKWKLNNSLSDAMEFHHDPARASSNRKLAATVALADTLCKQRNLGFSGDNIVYEYRDDVYSFTGLNRIQVQQVTVNIEKDIAAARDFLKVAG